MNCRLNPIEIMVKYLDGEIELTHDEREILLYALYVESRSTNPGGIANEGIRIAVRRTR